MRLLVEYGADLGAESAHGGTRGKTVLFVCGLYAHRCNAQEPRCLSLSARNVWARPRCCCCVERKSPRKSQNARSNGEISNHSKRRRSGRKSSVTYCCIWYRMIRVCFLACQKIWYVLGVGKSLCFVLSAPLVPVDSRVHRSDGVFASRWLLARGAAFEAKARVE